MPADLVARIEAVLRDHPSLRGEAATDAEIEAAQQALGMVLDPQYVAFIKRFGGSYAGTTIQAFRNGSLVGRETVTEMTLAFRDAWAEDPLQALEAALVISDDGSGNAILINAKGEVVLHLHDENEVEPLFPSLYDMMDAWLPCAGS